MEVAVADIHRVLVRCSKGGTRETGHGATPGQELGTRRGSHSIHPPPLARIRHQGGSRAHHPRGTVVRPQAQRVPETRNTACRVKREVASELTLTHARTPAKWAHTNSMLVWPSKKDTATAPLLPRRLPSPVATTSDCTSENTRAQPPDNGGIAHTRDEQPAEATTTARGQPRTSQLTPPPPPSTHTALQGHHPCGL
jgi:hypothetical protein